ncbi:MAG TPA: hypothetical protein VIM56_08050 [Rhizomicrobium sp.]
MTKQDEFFALSSEIERRFPVTQWQIGGVQVWPILRTFLPRLFDRDLRDAIIAQRMTVGRIMERGGRALKFANRPLANIWDAGGDYRKMIRRPHKAELMFLGTGATFDNLGGHLFDRFCEPLIAAGEGMGKSTLLMEDGDVSVPQARPVYWANAIDGRSRLIASLSGLSQNLPSNLPGHADMIDLLRKGGFPIAPFTERMARYHAMLTLVMGDRLGRVLDRVGPRMVFIVRYYCALGYALARECRRRGILSVELQHGAQNGRHEAYNGWSALPERGYEILPAVFWNWTAEDARGINTWAAGLDLPWHQGLFAGHPQLAPWLDDSNPRTRDFDRKIARQFNKSEGDLDILIALQDFPPYEPIWRTLAGFIEKAPRNWRWWIRRHPSPLYNKGIGIRALLELRQPNVITEEATSFPLPALLRHMDCVLACTSGVVMEAAAFGVKTIFLTGDARGLYANMLVQGGAEIATDISTLEGRLALFRAGKKARMMSAQPSIPESLQKLDAIALEYKRLFKEGQSQGGSSP